MKYIVKVGGIRLAHPHLLGDEHPLKVGGDGGVGEPGLLHGGHGVGEKVEPVVPAEDPAQFLRAGQEHGPLSQGPEVVPVQGLRVRPFPGDGQVAAETLHQQILLGAQPPVKIPPQVGVALVIELVALLGEGQAVGAAQEEMGVPLRLVKVEEGVVRVEEQVWVGHGGPPCPVSLFFSIPHFPPFRNPGGAERGRGPLASFRGRARSFYLKIWR